ncbi:hypothetical protein [Haloterrigena alkaliphila]|uniref:Uncharacterized protein n=1 Tax=Haloterrigena alkaliphila TaxID=2816475 RepID=A0A8A2VH52_9EURY|nr:hypothetical protein [Haloterrigena alkaliphila]QSW99694.1 hypothetical protein J0X25_01650 [Haloterrigena alkaliphila]
MRAEHPFEAVGPRDVDALVREELAVSSSFRSWLLEQVGISTDSAALLGSRDSIAEVRAGAGDPATARGGVEIDLECDGERTLVVLATAVAIDGADSFSRPTAQLDRIRTRRERALEAEWDACHTVLLAPAETGATPGPSAESPFDATIALESLRDRLAARDTDRGDYRAALVDAAIERGARDTTDGGPPSIVDEYQSLVTEREPAFELRVGPDLETGSDDITRSGAPTRTDAATVGIEAPSLADDHRLVHDLERGTVDLRIPGAADHLQPFAARHAAAIPPATDLVTDGDALVLRLSVPPLDPDSSDVAPAIDETLETVRDLLTVSERVGKRGA